MDINNLISYWKRELPEMVDYADLVCAPAFAHGNKFVYEDEYGYMVEDTIKILKNVMEVDKLYLEKCEEVNRLKADKLNIMEMTKLYIDLKHFKDLKEQSRLIELPCPIGTKVYFISCMDREDESVSLSVCSGNFTYSWLDFPRQIFMTKEDAEKKLAESVEK